MDDIYEAEQAEYEHAMSEFYQRPHNVKCGYCGLEQTATEAVLREVGWTLDKYGELCFQAHCKRDRFEATYPATDRWLNSPEMIEAAMRENAVAGGIY